MRVGPASSRSPTKVYYFASALRNVFTELVYLQKSRDTWQACAIKNSRDAVQADGNACYDLGIPPTDKWVNGF